MQSNLRLVTYLEACRRMDARRQPRTGKTRNVKCIPPNKKCGDRCIPPSWNCRVTGGGLDSHSRAVEFDPVKGTASIIRGVKNVAEGYRKADPEKIARGVRGVERGIVKITPGDSIEDKQRFRKRLRVVANIAFIGTVTTVAGIQSHRLMKRGFPNYRDGLGAEIDRAARRAADRVMDTWDQGVDRIGLGRILNTGRARIEGAGRAAAGRLGYQSVVAQAAENRLARPARFSGYLGTRALLRGEGTGIQAVHDLDRTARTEGWSRDRWEAEKLSRLFSIENNGRSVYAAPAAHELLARQWGFQLDPLEIRRSSTSGSPGGLSNEVSRVRRLLTTSIGSMHTDLRADLRRRGLQPTAQGINEYIDQTLRDNPTLIFGATQAQRRRSEQTLRRNMRELLTAATGAEQSALARNTYNNAVGFYDNYFKDVAQRLSTTDGRANLNVNDNDSPYGDAMVGLARLHASQRVRYRAPAGVRTGGQLYPMRVQSRDTALFINGYYYHTRVRRETTPFAVKKPETLRRYAQDLSGQTFTTTQEAVAWFTNNGFNVAIGQQRRQRRDEAIAVSA